MPLPPLTSTGDLPAGIHRASALEIIERFGSVSAVRRIVGMRLERILDLLAGVEHVDRVILFGSFISDKANPNDVDLFVVMGDSFHMDALAGDARLLFDHSAAQSRFGASVFWVRRLACFPSEQQMVDGWTLKRDGTSRGIIEVEKEES